MKIDTTIIDLILRCKVKRYFWTSSKSVFSRRMGVYRREITISQLAEAAEVPSTTIRYYERIGLIKPESRSHSNYRLYSEKSLERLRFIRAAQATGFILDDIRTLMGDGSSTPSCGDVRMLIEARLEDVNQRLRDLKHVQKVLKAAHQECTENNPRRKCKVIETLRGD